MADRVVWEHTDHQGDHIRIIAPPPGGLTVQVTSRYGRGDVWLCDDAARQLGVVLALAVAAAPAGEPARRRDPPGVELVTSCCETETSSIGRGTR